MASNGNNNNMASSSSHDQKLPDPQADSLLRHGNAAKEMAIEMEARKFQEGIVQLIQLSALARSPSSSSSSSSSFGNPASLGLGAFGMTTFILSCFNAGLMDASVESVVLPLALFYGGIAQLLAGMWEYAVNNTFGATAFVSYGCFWLSFAALKQYVVPVWLATHATSFNINQAVGLYLLAWFIFTAYMMVGSVRVSRAVFSVFFLLTITFLLLFVGAFAANARTTKAGGWMGIFTAFAAWYTSAAVVINSAWKQSLLPVGPYVHRQATNDKL